MNELDITVNPAQCPTYQRCTAMAPAVFTLGTGGSASARNPAGVSSDDIVKAARSCPYRAVTAVVDATVEQLFPRPHIAPTPTS
jgi:ferredoxin